MSEVEISVETDFREWRAQRDAEWTAKLVSKKAACIGSFDTHLDCVCGMAHITDHATLPVSTTRPQDIVFGPSNETPEDRYKNFRVVHAYWCEDCGLRYENSVIEGRRAYVPNERRPEFL